MSVDLTKYPKTELFEAVDTIGVPHPYCIAPKHVAYASDHCSGILGREAIIGAERAGAVCDICRVNGEFLSFEQHKQALLIKCKKEDKEELHKYLLSIKDQAIADKFAGFAFQKGW